MYFKILFLIFSIIQYLQKCSIIYMLHCYWKILEKSNINSTRVKWDSKERLILWDIFTGRNDGEVRFDIAGVTRADKRVWGEVRGGKEAKPVALITQSHCCGWLFIINRSKACPCQRQIWRPIKYVASSRYRSADGEFRLWRNFGLPSSKQHPYRNASVSRSIDANERPISSF